MRSPGDGGVAGPQNGADELIAVFDQEWLKSSGEPIYSWDQPWYILRDLDGDTVGIVNVLGTLPTLAAEWRYDAYGSVTWNPINSPHPVIACGHRGVFFDR